MPGGQRGTTAAIVRVILLNQPDWGWLVDGPDAWVETANAAGVDLVIAGHQQRFSSAPTGPEVEDDYHLLVLDRDQVAGVDATTSELRVVVTDLEGSVVETLMIRRRWNTRPPCHHASRKEMGFSPTLAPPSLKP
jgi:hypothetical protein